MPPTRDNTVVLNALVKNTEALVNLSAVVTGLQTECADSRRQHREVHLAMSAKADNLDRSVSELIQAVTQSESARQAELHRIFSLLGTERDDRREVAAVAGKDERELLREIIREEMGARRQKASWLVGAAQSVWSAGGKYIVLAFAVLFVAAVMKLTGLSLADILGLVGK